MTLLLSICVGVIFAVSFYLLLGKELKEVAMGVFLIGHGANLGILAMSGAPLMRVEGLVKAKGPPVLGTGQTMVDPLPPETQKYFDICQDKLGMVPNVLKAYAFNIEKLNAFTAMYNDLMLGESKL